MSRMILRAISVLLGISLGLLPACGDSGTKEQGTIADRPSDPRPAVQNSPSPNVWRSIQLIKDCAWAECPTRNGFAIHRDGSYHYGGSPGQISKSDGERLNERIERIVLRELWWQRNCSDVGTSRGGLLYSVQIYSDVGGRAVYEILPDTGALCWAGEREEAEELIQVMNELAERYVPASPRAEHDHGALR